jgi:hypothetical protein
LDGNVLLLAVSVEGEVRGYLPVGMALANASATAPAHAATAADPAHERMLQELLQRKMVGIAASEFDFLPDVNDNTRSIVVCRISGVK